MPARIATPERLAAFSDGVLAIIITIMVLELKAPHRASWHALLEQWPTFASYALSFLFVGTVWIIHYHLLQPTEHADLAVIWTNLLLLFVVSLIPFFTAYMAENRMNSFTTAFCAAMFLLVSIAFRLQKVIARQFGENAELRAMDRGGNRRNWIAMVSYAVAIPAAYLHPGVALAIIVGVGALYFVPNALRQR